ncbi:MAG: DnaJ domain-containing protein [Alphaproteobacteria bacterium]|nr:DnaJ domain-containing protein [Alphaproteobacteria bacterium]
MDDPYKTLGVEKTASDDEIRKAYRQLAKTHHPDLNPGKKDAEEKFKAISSAYALLSDPEKRAKFDRGEIDASGAEVHPERQYYRDFGEDFGRSKYRPGFEGGAGGFEADDLSSLFEELLRQRGGPGGAREFAMRGQDARYQLSVDFLDAAKGAVRRITLPDGNSLDVTIPAGLRDGQTLRLKGKGMPGIGKAPPGDALIEVTVRPHPFFKRDGNDIVIELPVTLKEAVLGAKVETPTLEGTVSLTIPPHSSTGTRLRLKERGIAGGHQYVNLKVVLPKSDEPQLETFLKDWTPQHEFNPRKDLVS